MIGAFVAEQQDSRLRSPVLCVPSMVSVNKTMRRHDIASRLWHIGWDGLLNVPVELGPVVLVEPILVDAWVTGIKCQLPLWILLQIPKDV